MGADGCLGISEMSKMDLMVITDGSAGVLEPVKLLVLGMNT